MSESISDEAVSFAVADNDSGKRGMYKIRINTSANEDFSSENAKILATLKPVNRAGYHAMPCMAGTREDIFERIDKWLDAVDGPNILWLSGALGAGKSSIASSMVSRSAESGRLGIAFFFRRRDVQLSDPAALWRTVAYEFAQHDSIFANNLVEILKEGRVDLEKPDIDLHFRHLIKEPLMKCDRDGPLVPSSPIVVIDGLDECASASSPEAEAQQRALLQTLAQWSDLPKKLKLIITGPGDCALQPFGATCKQIVLPTGSQVGPEVNKDIRRFFEEHFVKLPSSMFPERPRERLLDDLTARAAGSFIWAETVTRLSKQGLSEDRLRLILDGNKEGDNLTKLYRQILDISFRDVEGNMVKVVNRALSVIVLTDSTFRDDDLHNFINTDKPSVEFVLDKLSSLISTEATDRSIRIRHPSFTEFLCDPIRCPEAFFIDGSKGKDTVIGFDGSPTDSIPVPQANVDGTVTKIGGDSQSMPKLEEQQERKAHSVTGNAADGSGVAWSPTEPNEKGDEGCCCKCIIQ